MNDIIIIKIIKSVEDLGVLTDGVTETVNPEVKKTRWQISWSFLNTFSQLWVQTIISSLVKGISGRGVKRAERRCMDKDF